MSVREELKTILPLILTNSEQASDLERFQNFTLRPILKFQNEIVLQLFKNYLQDNKVEFKTLAPYKKKLKVNEILKQNNQFKHFNLGLIVGFFTLDEFEFYAKNKKEVNKRIISLLIERIVSQVV